MKTLFLLIVISLATVNAHAQAAIGAEDPWTNYMTPGDMHKALEKYTGNWNWEITMWMEENAEPQVMTATSVNKMILGGRFLELSQSGDMMGMSYEARNIIGFNNSSRKMEMTMFTNVGTGTLYLQGTLKNDGKMAELSGSMENPVDGTVIGVRQVIDFRDSDHIVIDNYDKINGKEKRSMQYKLTRKS